MSEDRDLSESWWGGGTIIPASGSFRHDAQAKALIRPALGLLSTVFESTLLAGAEGSPATKEYR